MSGVALELANKVARDLLDLRRQQVNRAAKLMVYRKVHDKQFEDLENDLVDALSPIFSRQIRSLQQHLLALIPEERQSSPSAISGLFADWLTDPWHRELLETVLPILTRAASEAVQADYAMMGLAPAKSLATEYLDSLGMLGDLPGIITEMPQWMKDAVEVMMIDIIKMDFWDNITRTTLDDVERHVTLGIQEGESLRSIARNIHKAFPGVYSKRRAILVARTESANALNGARRIATDEIKKEIPELPLKAVWLSALSMNTRPTHAALHDVAEDENGMFNLGGTLVPWPGHPSLGPEDRCNCLCTTITDLVE